MPFTKEFNFPSDEELKVQEVNMSYSALHTGAVHLGKYCEDVNNEFMLCKAERMDPRQCLDEGKAVTRCALEFFQKIKKSCRDEFEQYRNCLYHSSGSMELRHCRRTQEVFDMCMLEKLNIERPPLGWACEVHVHNAKKPKPEKEITVYSDAPVPFPDEGKEHPPAVWGGRTIF